MLLLQAIKASVLPVWRGMYGAFQRCNSTPHRHAYSQLFPERLLMAPNSTDHLSRVRSRGSFLKSSGSQQVLAVWVPRTLNHKPFGCSWPATLALNFRFRVTPRQSLHMVSKSSRDRVVLAQWKKRTNQVRQYAGI